MKFIEDYGLTPSFYFDLELIGNCSKNEIHDENRYTIKVFLYACENSIEFINTIHLLREAIKKQIFNEYDYKSIIHRILLKYYPASIKYSQESFFHKCIRKLFTKHPSPDSYDYGIDNPTTESFTYVVYLLKKEFGYSNRNCVSSKTCYRHL